MTVLGHIYIFFFQDHACAWLTEDKQIFSLTLLLYTLSVAVRMDYASHFTSVGAGSMLFGHWFPPHVLCT